MERSRRSSPQSLDRSFHPCPRLVPYLSSLIQPSLALLNFLSLFVDTTFKRLPLTRATLSA
eukprot:scaffold498114_cov18-Prasinocladus_malaysianus.AAC.1